VFFSVGLLCTSLLWAFSIEEGSYVSVQSTAEMNKRKKNALKKTLASSNFFIRSMVESRLDGKPYMCSGYRFEHLPSVLRVTCDDRPVIDIHLEGKPTHYPTPNGGFSSIAEVKEKKIIQRFDADNGGFSVVYIRTEKGLDVVKSIYSSYLGAPLEVRASYVLSSAQEMEKEQ
jgi:hypothetical protein